MKIDKQLWDDSMKALTVKVNYDSVELEGTHIDPKYNDSWEGGYSGKDPFVYYYRIKKERKTREVAHFEVWDDNDRYREIKCFLVIDDKPHYFEISLVLSVLGYDHYREIPNTRRTEDIE